MKKTILTYFIALFLLNITTSYGQIDSTEKDYYKWFDQLTGIGNSGIYNGTENNVRYRTKEGNHKYFLGSEFTRGNLIYDHQPYFDVELKYDIFNDELIAKLPNISNFLIIKLIKGKVERFTIENKHFESAINKDNGFNYGEFFEVLFKSDSITLFKKHKKERREFDKEIRYSEFSYIYEYVVVRGDQFSTIKSKRDVIKTFPKYRKEINTFFTKRRILNRSNYQKFLTELIQNLNDLETNDNNIVLK